MELGCTVLVLIPNFNTYTQGIGLLGFMWKVVEAVIGIRIKTAVQFQDVLHEFCAGGVLGPQSWSSNLPSRFLVWNKTPYFWYSLI